MTLSAETLQAVSKKGKVQKRLEDKAAIAKRETWDAIVRAREDGHSLQAIGDRLGVSAQRVDQIIRAARTAA